MNDLVYNEIVASPGFELEFAVGTTYSLDADIFLALSLSFGRQGEITDADFQNPVRLLEGLRQATNRIAIFCNRGGLQPPKRRNPLYAMLDKCVFEVINNKEPLANFHPKLWLIKERSLDNRELRQLKLIVLSRNLTNDTSLDVAVAMTAPIGKAIKPELQRKHEPLKRMLEELAPFANPDKRKKIKRLIGDIDYLGEFELDREYVDYDFIPLHFGRNLNEDVDFRKELPGHKMMIVSPFLDKAETAVHKGMEVETPVSWLNEFSPNQEKILLTRLESLTPGIMELYSGENKEVWVLSPIAEQNDIMPMNLHAKMYFSFRPRRGGVYLWLGSANATHSGFYRNSEFLLRLTLRRGKKQFQTFKDEFCHEKKQLCRRIDFLPENVDTPLKDQTLAIKVRKNLIRPNNLSAEVEESDNGYLVKVRARRIKDIPGIIKIAPIQEPSNERELNPETKECIIPVSRVINLSELFILSVCPLESCEAEPVKIVIKIPTKGIPEDRDNRIYSSIIDTREKFLNYIEMMITDRPLEQAALVASFGEGGRVGGNGVDNSRYVSLYESLLRIVAVNPEKLEDIQDLVDHLDSRVIPPSFRQMAEMFKNSLKKLKPKTDKN